MLRQLLLLATLCMAAGWSDSNSRGTAARIDRVAALATPRAVHTASTLASGKVLIAGGMTSAGQSLATAELIQAADNTVTQTAAMLEARAGHTATVLTDGRVVIAGGYNGSYLRSVEVFDPSRLRFTMLGEMAEGRSGHTATLMSDGRILFTGGVGRAWTFLRSAELFDPETGHTERVGSLQVPRESHTATLLLDGQVLVVGGHRGRRAAMEVFSSTEIFDPQTRQFIPGGHLRVARHKHEAVRLADGRVLVLGGADRTDRRYYATTEIYSNATQTFEAGPTMAHSRYKVQGTAIRLQTGDILIGAGARVAELLDHTSMVFHPVAGDFPEGYSFATASLLVNGDVLIVGGYDRRNENTAGVWRFHVE